MTREEFEQLVAEEFPRSVPPEFQQKIKNVALLIEDAPSEALRREEGLTPNQTLLGHYRGIPHTARGDHYGMYPTLPDTITLFALPILDEAKELLSIASPNFETCVRQVIRDTIWHEVYHHFGADESAVRKKEEERQRDIL